MENKITVIENKPIPYGETSVKVRKSRKKTKRRLKRLLALAIITAICITVAKNFDSIKSYINILIPNGDGVILNSESTNQANTGSNASDTESDTTDSTQVSNGNTSDSITESIFEAFLQENSNFINESAYDTSLLLSQQAFPKASEIYQSYGENAPVVLLTNFSKNEAYYSPNTNGTSLSYYNSVNNVGEIAAYIAEQLNALGINAVHLMLPESDAPLYQQRLEYEQAINDFISANPSIAYVLDVSRAVYLSVNDTPYSVSASTENGYLPSVSFTYGTNADSLSSSRQSSVSFGHSLAQYMNEEACFVTSQTVSKYSLSQSFDAICLRVDVGSFACTYDDVLKSAELFSAYLANFIA